MVVVAGGEGECGELALDLSTIDPNLTNHLMEGKMVKKVLSLVALLAIVSTVVLACGATPEPEVIIETGIAHGGSLTLIVCHLLGLPITLWRQLRINQASLSIMETYPQGAVLNLLNDTCHLKP